MAGDVAAVRDDWRPLSLWPYLLPRWDQADVTMKMVITHVSRRTGISPEDIRGRSRVGQIPAARHEAIALMLNAGKTVNQVSRFMGMDHSSVIYARRKFGG